MRPVIGRFRFAISASRFATIASISSSRSTPPSIRPKTSHAATARSSVSFSTAYDRQPVVCLAGADATYAQWGAEAVAALREAGATHVIVAGLSTSLGPDGLGVDDSCAMGVDALDFLTRTREKLA